MYTFSTFQPIIRHALQALGGALVAMGYLDEEGVTILVGLGVNGAALAWYLYNKHVEKKS